MRLLIVEDDTLIAQGLVSGLGEMGHSCQLSATGSDAVRAFTQESFDAIILDRMLPDMTGTGLLSHLRMSGPVPPVLILSALGSVRDRIEGLEAGGDDYLAKPYDLAELNARLGALARRGAQPQAEGMVCTLGRLSLEAGSHKARFGTEIRVLNRIEFSLLLFMMCRPDRLITRAMLLDGVWGTVFEPATNLVECNISRLRKRLHDIGCDPIVTRRGEGYLLLAELCQ